MNLVLINSTYPYYDAVKEAIESEGINVRVIDAPEAVTEQFLGELMQIKASFSPDYLLSLDFIPYLSNACKIMSVGYIAWITGGYSLSSVDYSIRNEWNILFAADPALVERLKQAGCPNVTFLPLAPLITPEDAEVIKNSEAETASSVMPLPLVWFAGLDNRSSVDRFMPLLQDSTKGYLDGFVEAHKNDLHLRPMFSRMHEYIRSDITNCYPLTQDSIETVAEMYDNRFFYPQIDESMGQIYLREILTEQGATGFVIVTEHEPLFDNPTVRWIRPDDPELPLLAVKAPFHIMIPEFLSGARITQDIWDVMALNGSLLLPKFVDTTVMGYARPERFGELRELDILVSKCNGAKEFGLEQEQSERKKAVQEYALSQSYALRIRTILESL